MFLRNYYNAIAALFVGAGSSQTNPTSSFVPTSANLGVKNTSGNSYSANYGYFTNSNYASPCFLRILSNAASLSTSSGGWHFGSGNTPATIDDYKLETQITTGLTINSGHDTIATYDADTNTWRTNLKFTLLNTASNTITVNEIGLYSHVNSSAGTASNGGTNYLCCMYRSVFDTPIEIAAGDAATITVTLEYAMPI